MPPGVNWSLAPLTEGLADPCVCSTYLMLFRYSSRLLTLTRLVTRWQLHQRETEGGRKRRTRGWGGGNDTGELNQREERMRKDGRRRKKS